MTVSGVAQGCGTGACGAGYGYWVGTGEGYTGYYHPAARSQ